MEIKMNRIDIYLDMLSVALPYIRNIQTHGFLRKSFDRSCCYEAELLHNIVGSLREPNFCSWDIYFLNNQAKFYIEKADESMCPNYKSHEKNIKQLFKLVPDNIKKRIDLAWT